MQSMKERLLVAVARYAKGRKGSLSSDEFCRVARVTRRTVRKYFDGGFRGLLAAAKLGDRAHRRVSIPDDELLAEFHRLAMRHKRYPKWHEIAAEARFGWCVFYNRFGRAHHLRARYEEWRRRNEGKGVRELSPQLRGVRLSAGESPTGVPLSFRGLLHAPISEAGVVHLFGVLSQELGFAVASIRSAFPDCLAYEAVARDPDRWKKVRIEFELRSSNFRDHGHDPKGCDLIVCWEHDWKDCPVKVMELKTELRRVQGLKASA